MTEKKIPIPNKGMAVLQALEESEQRHGAIIIPNVGEHQGFQGKIIAIKDIYNFNRGEFVPSEFKIGDIVVYPSLGSTKIKVDREEYIICGVQDLLASI